MNVAVVGAGSLGAGIAHVCAAAGHTVTVRGPEPNVVMDAIDTVSNRLEGGAAAGDISSKEQHAADDALEGTTNVQSAVDGADLVIEATSSDLDGKRDTFADVEGYVDEETVIATATTSLSVTAIATALEHPERAVGFHFADQPHLVELVEVVPADQTDDETAAFAVEFIEGLGTEPIVVADAPGLASDRLGLSLAVEAMRMVEDGVTDVRDADAAMELGYDHPVGPLELSDRVGLDTRLDTLERLSDELGDRFEPPAILREKVDAGHTGKNIGRGFYVWESGEPEAPGDDTEDLA
jgi:3-hydroxybutyryl-CoA dehydrogenase